MEVTNQAHQGPGEPVRGSRQPRMEFQEPPPLFRAHDPNLAAQGQFVRAQQRAAHDLYGVKVELDRPRDYTPVGGRFEMTGPVTPVGVTERPFRGQATGRQPYHHNHNRRRTSTGAGLQGIVTRQMLELRQDGEDRGPYMDRQPPLYLQNRTHSRGPPPAKMGTYDGKAEWKPFEMQFERVANRYAWEGTELLDRLVEALRDRALKFFSEQPTSVQNDYTRLKEKMEKRFGKKDAPITVRRQLQELRQNEEDNLEEFAERALELASDGHARATEEVIEDIATEAFLRGCTSKLAALTAMNSQPTSLDRAVQAVKNAISNQKVLLGDKQGEKPKIRQVRFEEGLLQMAEEGDNQVRVVKGSEGQNTALEQKFDMILRELQKLTSKPTVTLSSLRSPTGSPQRSRGGCFNCGTPGHFARECPSQKRSPQQSPASSPEKSLN